MNAHGHRRLGSRVLRREYIHLQQNVESFDQKTLTINAWSITFSMASVAAAFVQHAPPLLLVAGIASLLFWNAEGLWKQSSKRFIRAFRRSNR